MLSFDVILNRNARFVTGHKSIKSVLANRVLFFAGAALPPPFIISFVSHHVKLFQIDILRAKFSRNLFGEIPPFRFSFMYTFVFRYFYSNEIIFMNIFVSGENKYNIFLGVSNFFFY